MRDLESASSGTRLVSRPSQTPIPAVARRSRLVGTIGHTLEQDDDDTEEIVGEEGAEGILVSPIRATARTSTTSVASPFQEFAYIKEVGQR